MNIVPLSSHPRENILPIEDLLTDNVYAFKVARQMEWICREAGGLGLAAPQLGFPVQIFIVRYEGEDKPYYRYFCNCRVEPGGPIKKTIEGCLSIPGKQYSLYRWAEPTIVGYELIGHAKRFLNRVPFSQTVDGLLGTVFQHECHHCAGVLISDIGEELP